MPGKTIEQKVKDIIIEQAGYQPHDEALASKVTRESPIIDTDVLGLDSLDFVEIVMAIEEEFNVEIPDEEADKLKTVGDLVGYVEVRRS